MLADSNNIFENLGFEAPRLFTAAMSAAFLLFTFGSASLTDKAGEKLPKFTQAILFKMFICVYGVSMLC